MYNSDINDTKMIKKVNYILLVVLILAAVLRLWRLGSIPPGLTPDEASLGYNAYSILKTGKDQYGNVLPIIFKSFGDYTPGLYVYLTAPFVALFGLSEFAVRLPNALSGIVIVYLFYLLANKTSQFGLIAAFIAATNPWLIYFSRGAWLPNISLALTLAGIYFFLKSFYKSRFLYLSALFFALTLIVYQGAKITTAIVVLILAVLFWKRLFNNKLKVLIGSFVIAVIISLPVIFSIFQGKTGRLNVISIFSYPRPREYLQDLLSQGNEKIGSLSYNLYHSESLNYTRAILGKWFNNYSARFLFLEGDWEHPRHGAPHMGVMLFSDVILIAGGLFVVIKNLKNKYALLLFSLLILTPLPLAFSRDWVHAARSFHLIIPLIIISAYGLAGLVAWIKQQKYQIPFYILLSTVYLMSLVYFLDAYFVHLPIRNAKYWDYGYREVVQKILPIQSNYKKIVFQQSYEQPFIYFLFYGAKEGYREYMPDKVQKEIKLKESEVGDVGLVEKLNNIEFKFISWPVSEDIGTLVVVEGLTALREIIDDDYNIISQIMYPDGIYTAFHIVEVKNK